MNLLEEKLGPAVAIKNILFTTDFSQVSEAALPYVTALSLRYGSAVHVAHVLPDAIFLRPGAPDPAVIGSIYEDAHSDAQEQIKRLSLRLRGYPHRTYLRHGKVSKVVTQLIRDQEIDLLVLGTHGRTGLSKLVMGSVAEEVFRLAPCPVLTVGPEAPTNAWMLQAHHDHDLAPAQISFRRILYATDLNPDAAHGASYAASLAREFRANLTLLHVIEDYGYQLHERPGPIERALDKLEQLVSGEEGLCYRPEFTAEYGTPADVILRTAAENDADLIVMGVWPATDHLVAATHMDGSIAHRIIVGANSPVLTMRN